MMEKDNEVTKLTVAKCKLMNITYLKQQVEIIHLKNIGLLQLQ